jgi:hypothetical protein
MKTTKIFIALAATAAICLAIIGVAYGYYATNQARLYANTSNTTNTNTPNTNEGGFWGWFGGCFGLAPRQPYNYQNQAPTNSTTAPPVYVPPQQQYQPQNPNQGYYPYGYGRGCWGW